MVDCNVTGSKGGTADDPKYALVDYITKQIFPKVKNLVKVGGQYEGYIPIFQGDSAGLHEDKVYKRIVEEYSAKEGRKWIPQGPQMPHVNICDLSVFPNMSKRHTKFTREHHGTHALKEDEIWKAAERVFKELLSHKIASGFV